MNQNEYKNLPQMLYADPEGRIYDHPHFKMVGLSGHTPTLPKTEELIPVPDFSKLFFFPDCPPMGLDPDTGKITMVREMDQDGMITKCYAVAAFLEPGLVRSYLPAADYGSKTYTLPSWAYTAVGYMDESYWAPGFRIEYNHKWDPRNYNDKDLIPAIDSYEKPPGSGSLFEHLMHCATGHHCFAAKNLFLRRWEAPLPVSRTCNASCLGCLSLQPDSSCESSHERISITPSQEEIVHLAVNHLERAPEAIVSFGQGCEGEPLTEYSLIADCIRDIRRLTKKGTINLNTNGSWPERIRILAENGLDSIRISLNSAQSEFYQAYYCPKNYTFDDVVASLALSKKLGLYTMINYLVFPGISDQMEEIEALVKTIEKTGVNFLHLKNLCIDPQVYLKAMPKTGKPGIGMWEMVDILKKIFPDLTLGYFNQPVR